MLNCWCITWPVGFKRLILSLRYSFLLFLKHVVASCLNIIWIICIALVWSCNHCILGCFLWSKNCKHFSSNHVLCCSHSYRPRLSLAEILIFSLRVSQAPHVFLLLFKFSRTANLLKILIWYCFQTCSWHSFMRWNLPTSNVCAGCLLTASLSLTFAAVS